jgi:phosphopantothenoylcysteine synthetase/decarboxylase
MSIYKEKKNNVFFSTFTSIILLILFSTFFFIKILSETSYILLVLISILTGFIIYFNERIKSFDLREMKIILFETKEVYQSTKKIAEHLIEIVGFLSAYGSGTGEQRKKLNKKMLDLLHSIKTDEDNIEKIMENPRLMEKAMSDKSGMKNLGDILIKKGLV